ncbi:uncharacterized protein LOC117656147 isoform X4 [Pantherophis guttatus]|uniref:Uncharacterized protein LOC117656147 isoform X4 n=1 Tax=Pantherophis guttatus TaxID=94885 RepID=A0ABM3YU05_PANGU|nr:uncharacterized protein LOC117656147 isoform X4 [Pantherophis guttatus]
MTSASSFSLSFTVIFLVGWTIVSFCMKAAKNERITCEQGNRRGLLVSREVHGSSSTYSPFLGHRAADCTDDSTTKKTPGPSSIRQGSALKTTRTTSEKSRGLHQLHQQSTPVKVEETVSPQDNNGTSDSEAQADPMNSIPTASTYPHPSTEITKNNKIFDFRMVTFGQREDLRS